MNRRLAYIPARGGSKGIPKKNIKEIDGIPLIAFTITAALESKMFDRVMVSTDSDEIALISKEYGAWVPFLRYPEFALDGSKTIDAVMSDKVRLEEMGETFDTFVLLQATSPLRRVEDIRAAIMVFDEMQAGVVSVSPVSEHPILMRTIGDQGLLTRVLQCPSTMRRQDMPRFYRVNGAIYINAWSELTPNLSFNDNPYGYIMPSDVSIDIDSAHDLACAAAAIRERRNI